MWDRLYKPVARKPWLTVYRAQQVVDAGPDAQAVIKWAGDMRRLTMDELHDAGRHATLCHKMRMELMVLIPKSCQLYYGVRLADRQVAASDRRLRWATGLADDL